jgi:hypothetical protein
MQLFLSAQFSPQTLQTEAQNNPITNRKDREERKGDR